MKHSKRFFAMALAGALTVGSLAGCGGSSNEAAAPAGSASAGSAAAASDAGSKGTITVITMALNSDYWHAVQAGGILAGKDYGYTVNVIGPNDESNAQEQCNQILDAVSAGTDAIVLSANNPDTVVSTAADVHADGMPLVEIDSSLPDEDAYDAFLGTNNYDAGKALGDYIGQQDSSAKVALIRGLVGTTVHDDRCNGIADGVEAAGAEVLGIQPADSDRAKGVTVAENFIQANPDLTAIAATNDEMALGAYEAVKSAGKEDQITVYGFDGSIGGLESILAGEMTGTAAQDPVQEGYGGVELAVKILEGESVEKENDNPFQVVTADNAQEVYDELMADLEAAGF
ncbi:MAG: sugar ABC transporter substrate-binding protein [Eubacteriales bacterium]|nr:sugar ABC transporter substrate-binding protein [Eubacteriales bacterium]